MKKYLSGLILAAVLAGCGCTSVENEGFVTVDGCDLRRPDQEASRAALKGLLENCLFQLR